MPAITVRNVPAHVRNELAARAARSGQSLQEYLLAQLVESTARPTVQEVVGRARLRMAATGRELDMDAVLADRDADRR